ncbi:hypothetical protein PAXRUDRAFT_798601 [Paxillus rubicundulus Ve08.2h10]|uniref:Uncharacterized protein n=1 Tax=Paxillus rubicundulus Ve08.2h10 TaxID=930991 RepID=A0A0D0CNX5_9AGAM|nr:hypothetical protein PAXRUDRAFT_798601 [Paxillus rubicundulus Ve08.2h10]
MTPSTRFECHSLVCDPTWSFPAPPARLQPYPIVSRTTYSFFHPIRSFLVTSTCF